MDKEEAKKKIGKLLAETTNAECSCKTHLYTQTNEHKTQNEKILEVQMEINQKKLYIETLKKEKYDDLIRPCIGHAKDCHCTRLLDNTKTKAQT